MFKNWKSFALHVLLFVVVEVLFVVILFREFPETHLLSIVGIAHASYWLVVVVAWLVREQVRHIRQRFLATYIPIVYHVVVHLRVGAEVIHAGEEHRAGEDIWIIIWALVAWVVILWGEILLHRKYHCDTHHTIAHKHCEEDGHSECETDHKHTS